MKNNTCAVFFCFLFVLISQTGNFLWGQTPDSSSNSQGRGRFKEGSVMLEADTIIKSDTDSTRKEKKIKVKPPRIPWKAALMSACVPGLGQIYNRKYWKLPIVWGAIGTTGYFMIDQHLSFIKFRDAYRALVNDSVVLPGFEKYQTNPNALRTQRDNYERNRNILSIVTGLLWALNVVDAAVDAHLSTYDIGEDLTMKIKPSSFFSGYDQQPCVGLSFSFHLK